MLRLLKWLLVIGLVIAGTAFLFRERLFRALFHFDALRELPSTAAHVPAMPHRPDAAINVESCIDAALVGTADALSFTTGVVPNDAAGALDTGRANCIGYAAVFKVYCDAQLARADLPDEWHVRHMRGLLYLGSFNMHRLFSSPFWKDHDICMIENSRTRERVYVDPSLFDALGIRRVSGPAN